MAMFPTIPHPGRSYLTGPNRPVVLTAFLLAGCGGPSAKVTGKVTCGDQPVKGSVMFSPLGQGAENTGEAVGVPLKDDGTFEVKLKTVGKHRTERAG